MNSSWVRAVYRSPLFWILGLSFAVRVLYMSFNPPLWWDAHVYVGMGKYIFSGGEQGIWEVFRPLVYPFILGLWWKIGFNPIIAGKAMDLIFSLVDIALVYAIASTLFNRRVAIASSILFSFTGIFLMFSGFVLTEPLAIMLSLFALYFFIQKRSLFLVGLFCGLAFLTKFPQAIFTVGIGIALLAEARLLKEKIKNIIFLTLGFCTVSLPYFIFNSLYYGDALMPLREGSLIVTTYTWLYESSWYYYIIEFFGENLLYIFSLLGFYMIIKERRYQERGILVLLIIPLLLFLYFETVPRKELRYLVTLVPMLAIVSGYGIMRVYDLCAKSAKPVLKPFAFVILCSFILISPLPFSLHFERPPSFEVEINTLVEQYDIRGMILTSDPAFVSFLPNRVTTLSGMEFAQAVYDWKKEEYELLFVNDCDLLCPLQNQSCLQRRDILFAQFWMDNTEMFKKQFRNCTYTIYLPHRRSDYD